jgi:hypothetical protein
VTTIVCNLECMAADNRTTGAGPMFHHHKIHRIKGSLFGFAGDTMLGAIMLKWLNGPRDLEALYKLIPPDHRDDVWALELSKTGISFWNAWGVSVPLMDNSYAIGSGGMAALTCVRQGETPEKAVRHAMNLDECSGVFFQPQVEWLKPKK